MFSHERQVAIRDEVRRAGRVQVTALAHDLGVTPETIRRDLSDLEQAGVLRRVHGGAIPAELLAPEQAIAERTSTHREEKARIAAAALDEVPATGTILLDAGSTTGALADALPDRALTVVTNDLLIAQRLAARAMFTVMTLGGRVRPVTLSLVDSWAVRALDDVVVDVAFLGTNGFSPQRGATTPDPGEAEVKRAMVRAGRRAVLLADHSKAGNDAFARFAALQDFDAVISDAALDDSTARAVAAFGPRVVRA